MLKLLTFPEGPFQSDALLVPEHCLFDHIHNQTKCWNFDQWNSTAGRACSDRGMKLRSFAMLLPCGIDVFSGVEFVCCPAKKARKGKLLVSLSWSSVGFSGFNFLLGKHFSFSFCILFCTLFISVLSHLVLLYDFGSYIIYRITRKYRFY